MSYVANAACTIAAIIGGIVWGYSSPPKAPAPLEVSATPEAPPEATAPSRSVFREHADRIAAIRLGGRSIRISMDDYLLMGCDNSSARRNFPDVPREQREEGRWFTGGDDLPDNISPNAEGSVRKDGTLVVDRFYTSLPRKAYQASAAEVAWHYVRLKELRAQDIPAEQRIEMMDAEAKNRPWEEMR